MLKNFLRVAIFTSFSLSAPAVLAAGGWGPWSKIDIVYSHNSGAYFVHITPESDYVNPDGCTAEKPYKIIPTDKNAQDMYKMLLTAKASGLTISPYLYGCDGAYPRLLYTRIR